jgi:methionyl aminopeptidase
LGFVIESTVVKAGFNVAKGFVGHGIGHTMHDEPQLPAFGRRGDGDLLKKGMVLCIEAQILAGEDVLYIADDGWSVVTQDGSKAVMFEYMVMVGERQPVILTPTLNWSIVE